MKILITGANGQLAREFRKSLESFAHEVTALEKNAMDITSPESVKKALAEYGPDVVVNCASYNFVDKAEDDFDSAYKVNAQGVRNLALACKRNAALLVHYSSDYVFDGKKEDFYTEEDPTNPINNYGKTKLLGENFLREDYDNFLLFRVSWVFGEGEQNFLFKLCEWAKKTRVLKIVCDQISVPTYTRNIVNLTMFAVNRGLRGFYHLTSSGYATRYEVARYFLERIGMRNLIIPVASEYFPSPARRPFFSAMANRKLAEDLNVEIPDWKFGIDNYVNSVFGKEKV
ncbi:MAG: dTDP-4-dehydrorhamnose reductase [Nitrospirota bacterium]